MYNSRVVGALSRRNGGIPPNLVSPVANKRPGDDNPPAVLPDPTTFGEETRMQQSVLNLADSLKPPNSSKSIDSKIQEYFEFVDHVCGGNDPYRYVLRNDNMYKFMFFQTFRGQKKRGGNRELLKAGLVFESSVYDEFRQRYRDTPTVPGTPEQIEFLTPDKPTSNSTFIQYRAALRLLYKYQRTSGVCSKAWDQLWTMPFDDMAKIVKSRKAITKKANYEEKVRALREFFLLNIVSHYSLLKPGFCCIFSLHYN